MTITLRQESASGATTKGSSLTFAELDNNFIDLLNASRITVRGDSGTDQTLGSPTVNEILSIVGTSGLSSTVSSNSAGETTVTLAASGLLANVVEDTTPQLGGNLDVQSNSINTSVSNGNIRITPNGTGAIEVQGGVGINLNAANKIFTTTATTDIELQSTGYLTMKSPVLFQSGIEETIYVSPTQSGTYAPNQANGTLHYVVLNGNMTINGFTNVVAGQTISILFDGTGGSYTLTLGAGILTPGGSLALTTGGLDVVTFTCVDDVTPVYIATAVNDFQ